MSAKKECSNEPDSRQSEVANDDIADGSIHPTKAESTDEVGLCSESFQALSDHLNKLQLCLEGDDKGLAFDIFDSLLHDVDALRARHIKVQDELSQIECNDILHRFAPAFEQFHSEINSDEKVPGICGEAFAFSASDTQKTRKAYILKHFRECRYQLLTSVDEADSVISANYTRQ